MASPQEELGPKRITFPVFLLKIMAGAAGGVIGTLVMLLVFLLAGSISAEAQFTPEEYVSPIFVFLLLVMVFLATTIGNGLSVFLLALTEQDKYTKKSTTLYQVFALSIIMFVLMAPVYFIAATMDIQLTAYAVALHIILSVQISALILEIVSNYRYALVGVYGTGFSVLISAAILFALAKVVPSPTVLLFAALPVVWVTLAVVQSLVTMMYGALVRVYDKDFLAAHMLYGDDYGEDDDAEEEQKPKNIEGAEFLKRQK